MYTRDCKTKWIRHKTKLTEWFNRERITKRKRADYLPIKTHINMIFGLPWQWSETGTAITSQQKIPHVSAGSQAYNSLYRDETGGT